MVRSITLILIALLPGLALAQTVRATTEQQSSSHGSYVRHSDRPVPPAPQATQNRTIVNNYQTVIIQSPSADDTPPENRADACDWARAKRTNTVNYYRTHSIDMPGNLKRDLDDLVFSYC